MNAREIARLDATAQADLVARGVLTASELEAARPRADRGPAISAPMLMS
jgi:hypothetical protein